MVKRCIAVTIVVALFPAPGAAQDAKAVIGNASKAMGADTLDKKIFSAPRTLNPDRLAESKRQPTFDTMADKKVLTDGNHVIELHRLQGSGHNDGLIAAYFPKLRILMEADAYNPPAQAIATPPAQVSPYVANLAENLDRLKLDVDRIIAVYFPADGRLVTKAELFRAAGRGN